MGVLCDSELRACRDRVDGIIEEWAAECAELRFRLLREIDVVLGRVGGGGDGKDKGGGSGFVSGGHRMV